MSTTEKNQFRDTRQRSFVLLQADFVERWGYPAEHYDVKTPDKYWLSLFRVPYSKNNRSKEAKRIPVLLVHGIQLNSDQWVIRSPEDLRKYLQLSYHLIIIKSTVMFNK